MPAHHGGDAVPSMSGSSALPDLRIDRYVPQRVLGEGAMGKVVLADDPKLGRQVAIKLVASDADEDLRRRFRLEARAIASLKHPNIVELYDYSGEDAPDLYLVLEYVPGRSLYHTVREHGMGEATALCVGHELALAVQHAHAHGVVHRDIKPENVLLHRGRVVLTDFGAVKAFASSRALGVAAASARTRALGTPGFMAPEQFEGKDVGPRADLFGVGATLYNLTTGELPYRGGSTQQVYEALKAGRYGDPRDHASLLSPEFCTLLSRLLAPRPSDRMKDAGELLSAIQRLLAMHAISDVRQHLVRYEESPAQVVVEQREREVEELLRSLKVAIKDKDGVKVRALTHRLQTIAPLDARMRDISGLDVTRGRLGPGGAPEPVGARKRSFASGVAVGLALGTAAGGAAAWWWLSGGALP